MTTLALIQLQTGEIVSRYTEGSGWVDLPGIGKVSPPVLGWEGNGYRLVETVPVVVPDGKQISGSVTLAYDAVNNKAVENATVEDAPVVRPMVGKSIVQSRIIDAGLMKEAYAGLTADPVAFARWFAPDWPKVYCDDPDAMAFVKALGLDPAVVLAPEDDPNTMVPVKTLGPNPAVLAPEIA